MDIDDFIAALAVLGGKDRTLTLQFVFRVYDINKSGILERTKVERLLQMAYGDRLKEKTGDDVTRVQQQLDHLFNSNHSEINNNHSNSNNNSNTRNHHSSPSTPNHSLRLSSYRKDDNHSLDKNSALLSNNILNSNSGRKSTNINLNSTSNPISTVLHLRDFEGYLGPLDVLGGWILGVLSIFTEPLPPSLFALHDRYSIPIKCEEIMLKYNINKLCHDTLKDIFLTKCSQNGIKAELSLDTWLDWTEGFLSPSLAELIFQAKVGLIKKFWIFDDFVEFCVVFGSGSLEQKATAVAYAAYSGYYDKYRMRMWDATNSFSVYQHGAKESFLNHLKKWKCQEKVNVVDKNDKRKIDTNNKKNVLDSSNSNVSGNTDTSDNENINDNQNHSKRQSSFLLQGTRTKNNTKLHKIIKNPEFFYQSNLRLKYQFSQ